MKRVIANAKLRDIEVARLSLLLIRKYVLRLYRTMLQLQVYLASRAITAVDRI